MAFFPRIFHNEFAQVARLLDEVASYQVARPASTVYYPISGTCGGARNSIPRAFRQPRFDIKENQDSYEVSGELPGYTDVNVEFTDASTLRIKGRSEHSREEGTRPSQLSAGSQSEQAKIADNAETATTTTTTTTATEDASNSQYHKASVEDENWVDASTNEDAEPTPSSSNTVTATETPAPATEAAPAKTSENAESRYWLSERSTGQFSRTFTFPARVNQDTVTASLKNGILSIVVPKAAPATRRINVE